MGANCSKSAAGAAVIGGGEHSIQKQERPKVAPSVTAKAPPALNRVITENPKIHTSPAPVAAKALNSADADADGSKRSIRNNDQLNGTNNDNSSSLNIPTDSTKIIIKDANSIVPPSGTSFGYSSSGQNSETKHGWSSGASTPVGKDELDSSSHSNHSTTNNNPKQLLASTSVLGLDEMIAAKAEQGLTNNIVHMEVPFGKPIEEVYEGVHDGPVLGSGISGLVRLCTHIATRAQYAVKCLDLGLVETEEGIQQLREEIAIMCQLDHPNIVRLEEVYESHSEIYLVQELCVGGELFDRLDEQPDYHYSEAQCARLVKQMLCSVRYIHSKGIIHRDLKLENFLFSSVDPDSELKMIDFGLSKHFQYGEVHHEAVGTPYTVAPEVINGAYDERCDVWGIGVITYLLLSGDPPFGGCGGPESLFQVRSNILAGRFVFEPRDIWVNVSQEAKDFIRMMLVTDPMSRPTAKICQKSPWIHEWANKDTLDTDTRLNVNVVEALVNFKEYSDMRKLLCEVLSFTLMPDQITDLRKEFEKLDTDGSGEISLNGLKRVLMQEAGAGSLGALCEDEIEDIFNAMRVRKTETKIHWHEFIAAGLSQCEVDERNLRLAFDRLDSNHKGYITFDNVMDLMGIDGAESEDQMRTMWSDSMLACNSNNARITYDDFLLLMKGQTRSAKPVQPSLGLQPSMKVQPPMPGVGLDVLYECHEGEDESRIFMGEPRRFSNDGAPRRFSNDGAPRRFSNDGAPRRFSNEVPVPTSPSRIILGISEDDDIYDAPLTMDDEDDFDQMLSDSADIAMIKKQERRFTPPQSPICPPSPGNTALLDGSALVQSLSSSSRRRSRSVDDKDLESDIATVEGQDQPQFHTDIDIRRALALPEHTHHAKEIEKVIHDETLTPLTVNRKLYRAHRETRLAVLEASKRFEDQQVKRTKAEIQAQQQSRFGAGLVMRRGHRKEVSSESIRCLMIKKQKQHECVVNSAAKRAGRKRGRKKTLSDMSSMMAAINSEEFNARVSATDSTTEDPFMTKNMSIVPIHENETATLAEVEESLPLHDITKPEPTVPGVFRKTSDPFQIMGRNMMSFLGKNGGDERNQSASTIGMKSTNSALRLSNSDGELHALHDDPNSPEILRADEKKESHMSDLPAPPEL